MARLAPISIGPVTVETPVILAPMTAVTDLPMRRIVKWIVSEKPGPEKVPLWGDSAKDVKMLA